MTGLSAIIDEGGAITLPAELIRSWHLQPGDDVEFYEVGDGSWNVRPRNAVATAFFDRRVPRSRLTAMDDDLVIGKAVAERNGSIVAQPAAAE